MGKSTLYLNIRDELSIPGLTQKICCICHFYRKSAHGLYRFKKGPDGKSTLYLNIRDNLSIPGLTQKICCICRFYRK